MGNLRFRLHSMFLMLVLGIATALAQQNIRYVKTGGDNSKDGTSWTNAKKDIQDAINDLVNENLTGEVWVAAGTYRPTESTESSGSQYYKAFKIPAGITVRGGFPANPTNGFTAADRTVKDDKNFGKAGATGPLDGEEAKSGVYVNQTILCGDLNASKTRKFSWNSTKQQFNVTFYGNSYHVVWFAMNGFNETTHRANPLEKPAKLEGCVVEGGHAYTRDVTSEHPHIAYGGGIYMVANSFVYNCEVRYCDASRNGGGIYMDGGGIVRRTYVHDCQALGIGTEWGLGGGICENGSAINNPKTNPVVVAQSAVTNCVGRIGGGMALTADQTQSGNKYSVVANSTLVNNNTAAIEAGGVYTYKGGGLSSMTIVNNKCNGSGITQNGVVTGRTGGVYNRDAAYIGNCVIWGNECATNNNIQYASSRTSTTSSEKTHFYYNALSKADNTDWSAASKLNVLSLSDLNHDTKPDGSKGFPLFFKPTASAGYLPSAITDETLNWEVSSESFLTYAGISTVDLDYEGLTPAPSEISYDMQFGAFNSRPTIGALVSQVADIAPATNVTYDDVTYDYAFFVDPSFVYSDDNKYDDGVSWTLPARFLGHVLDYIADQNYPADKKVAIFVKQGTVDNTRFKGHARIRQTSLDIPSNVSLFGSFSASLTGTDVDKRNPVATPTVISGKLLDAYKYNIAHLISIENAENVTIDGFKLTLANAASTELANTNKSGAAITLKGSNTVHFKNVTVSNSQAELGTAVYADASTADFENCIFHNNTTTQLNNSGIVYATNDSHLTFNHCDVLRNVGHASYLGGSTTNVWRNSIFYGNMDRATADTNEDAGGGIKYALAAFSGNTAGATGSYCMFDSKSAAYASQFGGNDTGNEYQYNLGYAFVDGAGKGYPRFVNPTKNAGYSERGDETYYGRTASFEPHNNNPVVNMGQAVGDHTTWGTDIMGITRDFGGLPDIGAVENHLEEDNAIENAYKDGQPAYGSHYYVRDYRNADGTVDYSAGGNGMSWKEAINGNAYYHEATGVLLGATPTGQRTWYEDELVTTSSTNPTFSTLANSKKVKIQNTYTSRYLKVNGNNITQVINAADADEFIIIGSGNSGKIFDVTANRYITYNGTEISINQTEPTNNWTFNGGKLSFTVRTGGWFPTTTTYYWRVQNNTANLAYSNTDSRNVWNYVYARIESVQHSEPLTGGINGLQYAVNNAHNAVQEGAVERKVSVEESYGNQTKSVVHTYYDSKAINKEDTQKIANSSFDNNESDWATSSITTAGVQKNVSTDWQINATNAWACISTFKYGSEFQLNGANVPAADANGNNVGGLMGVAASWGNRVAYEQVITLPAGTYELSYDAYEGNNQAVANGINKNLIGFITESGKEYLSTKTAYTYNQWTTDKIRFTLDQETTGKISAGYQSGNITSNNTPKLFIDNIAITAIKCAEGSVYVGAGTYTNTAGWQIRNHVKVYGAFPGVGNPGMDERRPQLSTGIALSKKNEAEGLADRIAEYETILQTHVAKGMTTNNINVLRQPEECRVTEADNSNVPQNRVIYEGAEWDGFTVRYGYKTGVATNGAGGRRWSGAGVGLYENVTLRNCIVRDNTLGGVYGRGAGIYCDGSTIENCYILNNNSDCTNENYGGGIYMIQGTMFNTVIAGNNTRNAGAYGAGIYLESAKLYNNTIVNNTGAATIGVYTASKESADLIVYNSIVIAAPGQNILYRASDATPTVFVNSYLKTTATDNAIRGALTNANSVVVLQDNAIDYLGNRRIRENKVFVGGTAVTAQGGISYAHVTDLNSHNPFAKPYAEAVSTFDFRVDQKKADNGSVLAYNCVNAATETFHSKDIVLPENDMDYTDRIQDCRLDIGAYEMNGATNITPEVVAGTATFYVTPEGYGTTDASSPANAACASKLQKVLDAAGRYKYLNPTAQVVVKVANSNRMHEANDDFKYYAIRTADVSDQDVRVWSIIVPRGVEVWGGYTDIALDKDGNKSDAAWSNTVNGFYTKDGGNTVDHRNITKYPTYFDSYYYNKEQHSDATTYHVVSFSDRIYDQEGNAYTKKDLEGKSAEQIRQMLQDATLSPSLNTTSSVEADYAHMSDAIDGVSAGVKGNVIKEGDSPKNFGTNADPIYASNRAVIDGIFITGGEANGTISGITDVLNIKSYGGAAIVTDYAYIRNCVIEENSAIYGGALALTNGALVSGTIIRYNEAELNGGGIYVFEDGVKLSNGITVNTKAPDGQVMDYNMPHVFTSTIVGNKALEGQGGGVWFTNDIKTNARFNSVAIWQNEAIDQANVYGMINPEQAVDDETVAEEFYPFAYSFIQNMRASGTNNMSMEPLNREGIRFVKAINDIGHPTVDQHIQAEESGSKDLKENFTDFGFFGLTTYSMLCSAGMPVEMYNQLKAAIAIADVDLLGTNRISADNNFVEAGARALAKMMPNKQLMLRLFVANPEDVDTEIARKFMKLGINPTEKSTEEYYSQEGSSFAYPFNSLQDALDYIKLVRNGKLKLKDNTAASDAQNLPFEILVGKGTYYPRTDLNGGTKSVWAATFAIPEGVTIIGGFAPTGGVVDGQTTYYGRYNKPKASVDKTTLGSIYDNVESIPTGVVRAASGEIGRGNKSANEIVTVEGESVTFQQWNIQDIADRRAMNDNNKNGIIEPWEFKNQTIISGNAINGETDGVYHVMTAVADANAVGNLPKVQSTNGSFTEDGYQVKEEGQQIRLNGLIITGGNALTYLSTALDDYGSYMFYHGAGLVVDGNRYNTTYGGTPTFHNSAAYGVGYRDIPVSITNCQFRNNIAGYGGAISSNGSLSLFASSFEQNLAIGQTETPEPGQTWTTNINGSPVNVPKVMYPGQGGAIHATYQLSAFNTLFANNEARLGEGETPTIALLQHPTFRVPNEAQASRTLRAAGGAIMMGSAGNHHIVNCNFVRNKANAYPAVFTMNPTVEQNTAEGAMVNTHDYSQIINTVAWGNEVNSISSDAKYQFASKLFVNVGKKDRNGVYNPEFAQAPGSQADLDANNWMEAVWFCAYEKGTGFTPNNASDLRDKIQYSPLAYAPTMIMKANDGVYQNCNIQIVSNNSDVAGPNFGSPSLKAGYDGYTEGADWSPARINRLTDNGNGWIKQTVDPATLNVTFENDNFGNGTGYQGAYPVTHYISDLLVGQFPEYKLWLSLGNEKYMQATNDQEADELYINNVSVGRLQKNLPRISPEPSLGADKAHIDIGVYEYIKQPLLLPGSELDVIWVSTQEHPDMGPANGATWFTPTSDLQRAIETVLSSRNGHKKEIRIMEGEYAPVTPQVVDIDGKATKLNAFVIDTKKQNANAITPITVEDGVNNEKFYAQALTIKGGYSAERYFEYDPSEYKTVIRQNEASDGVNTDYLMYVADPTVRYASGSYTEANQYGAIMKPSMHKPEADEAKTMPIQIDGITLINDKASAGAKGSAICYPDVTGMTAAHSVKIGGKLVYYETKEEFDKRDVNGVHTGKTIEEETEFAVIDETGCETNATPAKLVITKSQIIGSGNATEETSETASAVYIGQNGGSALVYNTVFHSNYGMSLDAYNTQTVNNTFALNAGIARLQDIAAIDVNSEMHNTVLWMNNNGGKQFEVPGVTVQKTTNKTTNGDTGNETDNFTYNSFTGGNNYYLGDSFLEKNNYNSGLADDNTDLIYGPSFTDPDNTDIEKRSFDIKPNFRLLNKGMDKALENPASEGQYYILVVKNSNDYALDITSDKDVLFRDRLNPARIDIGAYEFQNNLIRYIYVDPNKSHDDSATGENWDMAFGYGDIQNAIDLAAIYHRNYTTRRSYVFVKGASATNKDLHTNENLILRDGVTIYGSILANYNDHHNTKVSNKKKYYDVTAYIAAMDSVREGIASSAANKTIVSSIRTIETTDFYGTRTSSGVSYDTPALIDGFVISPADKAIQPTASVLDITNPSKNAVIVARNIIVAGNDLSGASDDAGTDINVAQISNGLLYEVLMRDNKPKGNGAVLNVSNGTNTKGYVVNATVEGKTIGADGTMPVDGKSTVNGANVEQETQIYNSVTNSIKMAAPTASAIDNKGISGYFYNIADPNLNYQLTETSKYIDACEDSNPLTGVEESLATFINYATDRDLLGNPRLLTGVTTAGRLDRGAFETWKVENSNNIFHCGTNGTIAGQKDDIIAPHFYPHDGSVVYLMNGQSLVSAPTTSTDVKPLNPGFMLVKEGANFYSNGRPMNAAYLAVERKVRQGGSIVSMPYAMQYKENVAIVSSDANDEFTVTPTAAQQVRTYNGDGRSDWKYVFKSADSPCWTAVTAGKVTAANTGVFYMPEDGTTGDDNVFRFTGKGTSLTDYIYTETADAFKTVTLTKYDDAVSTGGAADFTDEKNMGWNCIGLPWLVSSYETYAQTTADAHGVDGKYMMHIPHEMWLYYDGAEDGNGNAVNGNGGYYSVNSWEGTAAAWHVGEDAAKAIWTGEGIFVQTATLDDTETLTFYRPQAPDAPAASPAKMARFFIQSIIEAEKAEDAVEGVTLVTTEFFTSDGKKLNTIDGSIDYNHLPVMSRGTAIIVRKHYSDGTTKTQKFIF